MVKHAGGALLPMLEIDRSSGVPIGHQLASGIRNLILHGELAPGQRLPSSRTLSRDQRVSRTTAVGVYEQLAAEGLIISKIGAGAFVSDALETLYVGKRDTADRPEPDSRTPARLDRLARSASERYFSRLPHPTHSRAFVTGTPDLDSFPVAQWARLTARHWRQDRSEILGYPQPGGLPRLREAIAQHLRANRGVTCEASEVFVFNGAQDAFNWIGNTLLDPGDAVWFENPGAIGARNSLISAGARPIPVPVDDEGMSVAAGLERAPDFRLAFVTPSHQHPLGVTMSMERRFELLMAAERAGAWIVEDDYDGEFYYSGRPPPTLRSVDTTGRVIYVGTFSKSLFPALRLGFVVAPPSVVDVFDRLAGATSQGTATNQQAVLASFIEEGHFAAHIRRMRKLYQERQTALIEAADEHLAGLMEVKRAESGIQTVGYLAPGFDEVEVARRAESVEVIGTPISRFCLEPIGISALALGFSTCSRRDSLWGVKCLRTILEGMAREVRG
ncbi:PLP-dependent aminotransferase family protein [Solirhodobacter olei]|uniref:MocR-like pyridoxine biosynthesis transcription factor PdxR n=1 Tax=Solirhodobacter olei TaxID=2493082 RepID=UPI001F4D6F22|nr:PLP-dependent aminotransferase family protein [Solirhodobacter olei]